MKRVLIVGAGGHGRSVAEAVLAAVEKWKLVGFVDDAFLGLQHVGDFPAFSATADLANYASMPTPPSWL